MGVSSIEQAKKCFLVIDKDGPLSKSREHALNREQRVFMREDMPAGT